MKVLIITELLAPYRVNWFNELGKYSDVKVLYTKNTDTTRNEQWLSSEPENFKCEKLDTIKVKKLEISTKVFKHLTKEYDVIVLDGYSFPTQMLSILLLKILKKKFFMNIDGGLINFKENLLQKKIKMFFIKSPTYYLSSSKTTDKYLLYYGAKEKKIFHHNFTSIKKNEILPQVLSSEKKKMYKKQLDMMEDYVIVSVGRFIPEKGFETLIKSAQYIKGNVGIYIIGGTPTEEYLKLIQKYNIQNVMFVDFKDKEELKKYYYSADIFVLPTRGDVWGLVINEAMAVGLPIITTDKCVAGIELVRNYENGFIISVDDEVQLANKINYILEDEININKMGQKSLEKIKDYTIEFMASKHIKLFNDILRGE